MLRASSAFSRLDRNCRSEASTAAEAFGSAAIAKYLVEAKAAPTMATVIETVLEFIVVSMEVEPRPGWAFLDNESRSANHLVPSYVLEWGKSLSTQDLVRELSNLPQRRREDGEVRGSPEVTGHHQHLNRRLIAEPELFTIGRDETLPNSSAQRRPIVSNSAAAVLAAVNKLLSRLPWLRMRRLVTFGMTAPRFSHPAVATPPDAFSRSIRSTNSIRTADGTLRALSDH